MKAIMVMFDSLNRHLLPPYGCDWTHAPNFSRLARHSLTFDRSYVCSMPCMPARRDLHTGRPNFLHRGWGPLEPFDDSMPEMLKNHGTHTHLTSDHYHYWEDGGANYHNRYITWEFFRGQEGDPWIGQVSDPIIPPQLNGNSPVHRQDWINRAAMPTTAQHPQTRTFDAGLEFLHRNHAADNWFLQIETFDPHEPFFSHSPYKELYPHEYDGPILDWPAYRAVEEDAATVQHVRYEYAALLSQCDAQLGRVLDTMDALNLWHDTMLIVWTDHGYLLGEHDSWAKMWCPWYEELAHTPFFLWDPRCGVRDERRQSLVQPAIDLCPTLLDFFGLEPTPAMLGHNLRATIAGDTPVREAALFGVWGQAVNVTDGRYVYMRYPQGNGAQGGGQGSGTQGNPVSPLYEYTLMPAHMKRRCPVEQLQDSELVPPFTFTKGCPLLKLPPPGSRFVGQSYESLLFDVCNDPHQQYPLHDTSTEQDMIGYLLRLMQECEAPVEQYERLQLPVPVR